MHGGSQIPLMFYSEAHLSPCTGAKQREAGGSDGLSFGGKLRQPTFLRDRVLRWSRLLDTVPRWIYQGLSWGGEHKG